MWIPSPARCRVTDRNPNSAFRTTEDMVTVKSLNGKVIVPDEHNGRTAHFAVEFHSPVSVAELAQVLLDAYKAKKMPSFRLTGWYPEDVQGE